MIATRPKQKDGSTVTQVSGHFLVSNRTDERLYLTTARLLRPKVRGEELPGLLTVRALDSSMHGTASVSGHFVPPKVTLPVSATILIRMCHDRTQARAKRTQARWITTSPCGLLAITARCVRPGPHLPA